MSDTSLEVPTKSAQSFAMAIRAYRREIWRQRRFAVLAFLLPAFGNILVLYVPPMIIGRLIKDFHGQIPDNWHETLPYIIALAIAWTIGEVLWRLAIIFLNRTDARGMRNLYNNALKLLLRSDMAFFNDNFAGSLTKKSIGYGRGFENIVDTLSINVFGNALPLLFAGVILWRISPWLDVALLGVLVTAAVLLVPRIRQRQKLVAIREAASNRMAGHIADVIGNVATVQAYAHETFELGRHADYVKDYIQKSLRSWDYHVLRIETIMAPMSLVANIVGLILAIMVTDNAATAASVFVTFSYFVQATRILFEFNRIYRNIENSLSEAAEFCELLIETPTLVDAAGAQPLTVTRGAIDFKRVDFGYQEQSKRLLFRQLDLAIAPGEKIALVGHSGGGKTTITKLLLRFADINGGRLQIDGQDINQVTISSLRSHIAYVPQDPAMFHRSILENIRYGRLDATDDEVRAAAAKAHATEFIDSLPHGFETMVGERGVKLSGGQRQRIAIARAIVKDAPILVLDEATSALDSESELLIQDALWKLMEQRTTIVIAHRLSTIQKMDRIIVLDHGQIAEQGTHQELIKRHGIYAKLWKHQSGGFLED